MATGQILFKILSYSWLLIYNIVCHNFNIHISNQFSSYLKIYSNPSIQKTHVLSVWGPKGFSLYVVDVMMWNRDNK